jgi:hypothetical protein
MYISPNHGTDGSDEEEVASIDNCVCELSPCAFVIRTLITDDIDFLRTTEEPADESEKDKAAYYAKRHISFATVGLPVISEINANYAESDQNYNTEENVVPDEERIGESWNIQEVTGYLETTIRATEEEQRDEHDAQSQE